MSWRRVDIKSKDKTLPEVGKKVLWAVETKTKSINKFIGRLTENGKHVDDGIKLRKITNKFSWIDVSDSITDK